MAKESGADGVLIDTFNKLIGKGLLDYCDLEDIVSFGKDIRTGPAKEAWIAGSITFDDLPGL